MILDFGFLGFWIWDFGFGGFWILDLGDFGFWIWGFRILDFGSWGFWILGILDFRFWILGILDFGFWDFGFWILDRYVANLYVMPPTPQIWGILDFGFWILGILDFGFCDKFWILHKKKTVHADPGRRIVHIENHFFLGGFSVFPFFVRVDIFWLIIFQVVKVESTHFHKVRELSSVVFLEENLHAGQRLEKTIDLFSLIGMCVMVHSDPMVLSNDLDQIRSMEQPYSLWRIEWVELEGLRSGMSPKVL